MCQRTKAHNRRRTDIKEQNEDVLVALLSNFVLTNSAARHLWGAARKKKKY